jgi:hypothetical protein
LPWPDPIVVVPMHRVDRITRKDLKFALMLSSGVIAVPGVSRVFRALDFDALVPARMKRPPSTAERRAEIWKTPIASGNGFASRTCSLPTP